MWFRRDLRLRDNPALLDAVAAGGGEVVALFVVDPVLWERSGPVRQAYLVRSLRDLDRRIGGGLLLMHGSPEDMVPLVAAEAGATSVHVAADYAPYGGQRDARVAAALGDVALEATGSPYAVAPGRVTKPDGSAYRVFTPFYRAWSAHGWRGPAGDLPADVRWVMPVDCMGYPAVDDPGVSLPPAGEEAAWDRWSTFAAAGLADYKERRDRPDVDGTSALSHHLRFGEIHPRSLLALLGAGPGDEAYRRELCWREFYADVLFQAPHSARASLDRRFDDAMRWATGPLADARFDAWATGRTGYPFVDAGMRQLRAEGWIHNRVRMVVASFLVKDLHLPWQRGAREFMHWLRDGDLASNVHGWQWTAGCGTDAAPFFRVFNPVLQGRKFDPDGDYVRRYVPELAHLAGGSVHEPWTVADGYSYGYPERIVDHHAERDAALADYAALTS